MHVGLLALTLLLAHPDLDEGRLACSSLKYRVAVPALTRVTLDATASDAEVEEAFALLARAQWGLKTPAAAQAAFEALLRRAPMTEEPVGSPSFRAVFQQAKAAVFPPSTVRLVRRPSGEDTLLVEVVNPWRLALVATWHQVEPTLSSRPLVLERQQLMTSLAPGSSGYLELTREGQVVAALGAQSEPLRGPPFVSDAPKEAQTSRPVNLTQAVVAPQPELTPPPTPAPVATSRTVVGWTLLGAGIAGLGVGAGVMAWGGGERATGEGFPFTNVDLDESQRLIASGDAKLVGGGVAGGLGLVAVVTGVVLLVTH